MTYPTSLPQKIQTLVTTISNWYLVLPDKTGVIKNNIKYKTRSGAKISCRPNSPDVNETAIIFSGAEYPKKYLEISDGNTVYDLGGNIGTFAVYFDQLNKEKKYNGFVFEPFADNLELLRENLAQNNVSKFEVFEGVVSSVNGTLKIDTSLPPDAITIDENTTTGVEVVSVSLSKFASDHGHDMISLLKMDIEGGEYDIFKNDYEFVKNNIKAVVMEYHEINDVKNYKTIEETLKPDFDIEVIYQLGHGGVIYAKNKNLK